MALTANFSFLTAPESLNHAASVSRNENEAEDAFCSLFSRRCSERTGIGFVEESASLVASFSVSFRMMIVEFATSQVGEPMDHEIYLRSSARLKLGAKATSAAGKTLRS